MKRRHRFALNIFSLSLLAFALYLNFVKDDADTISLPQANNKIVKDKAGDKLAQNQNTAAVSHASMK